MEINRNWTVLFIGGSSGTGKSSIAYEIARFYGVNVLEVDDIHLTVETSYNKGEFSCNTLLEYQYKLERYWD